MEPVMIGAVIVLLLVFIGMVMGVGLVMSDVERMARTPARPRQWRSDERIQRIGYEARRHMDHATTEYLRNIQNQDRK